MATRAGARSAAWEATRATTGMETETETEVEPDAGTDPDVGTGTDMRID